MLPVRAVYNDVEGESTNIGINPLTSKVPIWYSGPDLAASKIQTGRSPKIVKAVRITPVGVQEGLKPITLGNKKIVPEEDNFYNIVVEGKEQSSGPIKQFYKCLASAGCYALAVEVNGKKPAKKNRKEVRVFSGEMEFDLEPNPKEFRIRDRGSVLSQSSFFIDHDAARPYNFAISPVLSLSSTALLAPFCDKPSRWDGLTYVCVNTGEKGKLNNWVLYVDGKIAPLVRQTMGTFIGKYSQRPEFKSLGPDGSLCTQNTVDLLRRRPVIAKAVFQLIGKEVDRGTSEDAYMMEGEKLVRHPNGAPVSFPKALARLSDREIARRTELDAQTVSRVE